VKWLNKDFLGRRKEKANSPDEEAKKAFERARRAGRIDAQNNNNSDEDNEEDYLKEAIEIVGSGASEEYDTGQRTIPSRPIPTTDRSERLGEDRELMDRFQAEAEIRKKGQELSEPNVKKIIGERKARRSELDDLLTGVDQLIDGTIDE